MGISRTLCALAFSCIGTRRKSSGWQRLAAIGRHRVVTIKSKGKGLGQHREPLRQAANTARHYSRRRQLGQMLRRMRLLVLHTSSIAVDKHALAIATYARRARNHALAARIVRVSRVRRGCGGSSGGARGARDGVWASR